jgi:predicted acetyltransferase
VTSIQGSIDAGAIIGAFRGGALVGSARYHVMRQWWYGRPMPMAGVAGVKVAPEERGRGVGKAMMAVLLAEIGQRGFPVSTLFPSTAPLYRAGGWEFAGGVYATELPVAALAALADRDESTGLASLIGANQAVPSLRRATKDDGQAIVAVKALVHERLLLSGPNTREPWMLRDWLDDEDHFAHLADDGFLSYRWGDRLPNGERVLDVEELVAASDATARAFWQILASHASTGGRVRACLAPDDPVTWLTREPAAETRQVDTWMLRLVDGPAAIAARGYPVHATVSAVLDLADAARPANSGRWALEVADGAGTMARLGDAPGGAVGDAVRLGARGFAAMFAGVPIATLRLAGLLAGGDPATDDALGVAFRGPAYMMDHF